MTQNRWSKRAVRSRMARTGEKYTQARRALQAPGRHGGSSDDPLLAISWPEDSLAWFSDQAYNRILLAADEARMLSHPVVDPEHLLLAAARRGNVESLLAAEGVGARAIHDAIVRIKGSGGRLELGPQRSSASEMVLRQAVTAAAARGRLTASTEHLLIALGEHDLPALILGELGVGDVAALVDARYPVTRPPLDHAVVERRAAQLASGSEAPSPGPIPPVFERFSSQARAAINAGVEYARRADDLYVESAHLLFGVLDAKTGVVAAMRARHGWQIPSVPLARPRYPRATGIFSTGARRIVAEDVLVVAERLDRSVISTGHLLIAFLERRRLGPNLDRRKLDEDARRVVSSLPGIREITAEVVAGLPGGEAA